MNIHALVNKLERIDDFGTGIAQEVMAVCGIPDYETVFHRVLKLVECGASLEAVIALHRHLRPEWFWRCGQTPLFPNGWAHISETDLNNTTPGLNEFGYSGGKAATPAIALCICILRSAAPLDKGGE